MWSRQMQDAVCFEDFLSFCVYFVHFTLMFFQEEDDFVLAPCMLSVIEQVANACTRRSLSL